MGGAIACLHPMREYLKYLFRLDTETFSVGDKKIKQMEYFEYVGHSRRMRSADKSDRFPFASFALLLINQFERGENSNAPFNKRLQCDRKSNHN